MEPSHTSESMLAGIRSGSEQSWTRFVSVYRPILEDKLRRHGLSNADTKEVAQEIFLRVHRGIKNFERDGKGKRFRYWLNVVIKNTTTDYWKKARRQPIASGDSENRNFLANLADVTFSGGEGEVTEIVRHTLDLIRSDFSEKVWKAFCLTEFDGLLKSEAAEKLSMQPNAVRQAVYRVRRRLKEELAGLLDGIP